MKSKEYAEEKYEEMMNAVDKFINDPDISEVYKTASVVNLVNWSIACVGHNYMEKLGLFEIAKDKFKKSMDQTDKAPEN